MRTAKTVGSQMRGEVWGRRGGECPLRCGSTLEEENLGKGDAAAVLGARPINEHGRRWDGGFDAEGGRDRGCDGGGGSRGGGDGDGGIQIRAVDAVRHGCFGSWCRLGGVGVCVSVDGGSNRTTATQEATEPWNGAFSLVLWLSRKESHDGWEVLVLYTFAPASIRWGWSHSGADGREGEEGGTPREEERGVSDGVEVVIVGCTQATQICDLTLSRVVLAHPRGPGVSASPLPSSL